ncbi:amidase family protein [Stylonychia lemnae]|uniref:Amidase family protein n=1 Tax=Stylonychia lemnae TaxID=5949 RepID=A0A077ZWF8_STYLE|nr:amidase family protein [Stylonychia lemnae]|eukprot:CDW73926.1 amidase family protein [Stylonychia lemnae]
MEKIEKLLPKDIYWRRAVAVPVVLLGAHLINQTSKYFYWHYRNRQLQASVKTIVDQKNNSRFEFIKVENENELIELDVTQLREKLLKGEITSVQLVHMFANRCYTIARRLNLSAEECFDEAIEEARQRDHERQEAQKHGTAHQLPILHGIPIDIKDMFQQKGKRVTIACQFMTDKIYDEDGIIVQLLRQQGAIIVVRGNTPQAASFYHTDNRVWGLAKNPYDESRSVGGSSGGDAGLIAARCAPLAFGTDLGGSLRVPAHFNGVACLKPTCWRVPSQGYISCFKDNFSNFTQITPCIGPIGKTVNDIIVGFKALIGPEISKIDYFTPPTTFRQENFERALNGKVKVGYCFSLSTVEATLSMQRGIRIAKKALEEKGFELVPFVFTAEELKDAHEISLGLLYHSLIVNNYNRMIENYEQPLQNLTDGHNFWKMNSFFKFILLKIFEINGEKRLADKFRPLRRLNSAQLDQLLIRQRAFFDHMQNKWNSLGIEALIMPTYPTVSFKHENHDAVGGFGEYMSAFTITLYPSGIVPVTEVQEGEDETYDDNVNDSITKNMRKDIKGSKGMPVTVKVVGQLWEDETVLGVMKAIEDSLNFKIKPKNL